MCLKNATKFVFSARRNMLIIPAGCTVNAQMGIWRAVKCRFLTIFLEALYSPVRYHDADAEIAGATDA